MFRKNIFLEKVATFTLFYCILFVILLSNEGKKKKTKKREGMITITSSRCDIINE